MTKKSFFIIFTIFIIFCFIVFFKGLYESNTYIPKENIGKKIVSFKSIDLFNDQEILLDEVFFENKIYLLNIWASWCAPCRKEHEILMELSRKSSIKMIGLNYKDNSLNAKKYISDFGNPYSIILKDIDGTISIELGAYGVPETYIIDKNKIILKKFVGPLNDQSIKEIKLLLK
mgnify:CR=1 FL=1|tara:strand:+ start:105 stop:626 length:522 start_codon:yes stop_codon:yes gene_type:complete